MRVLLAFGTKYGSTAKVAKAMSSVLEEEGAQVMMADLRREAPTNLSDYELVIVGSSIVMGQWTKPARKFLEDNSASLRKGRTALFACCIDVVCYPSRMEEHRRKYLSDVATKYQIGEPVAMGLFAGEVDVSKYGFLDATMAKAYMRSEKVESKERVADLSKPLDFHDWDAIKGWASSLLA